MKKQSNKTMVSIWLEPDIIKTIDAIAKRAGITRSRLIHNLIETGYDELNTQKNIGLIKFTLLLRQFKLSIKPIIKEAEKKIIVDEENTKKDSVSVRMDNDLILKIDTLSQKIDLTRKAFIEYVLEFEIRDLKAIFSVPGAFAAIITFRDLEEKIRKNWGKNLDKTQRIIEDRTIDLNENSENGSE